MLEELLNSKTRVKVLSLFYADERKDYYTQEVIGKTKADPANVHRELTKLVKLGVLSVSKKGVQKFYKLDPRSPYHAGLKQLVNATGSGAGASGFQYMNDGDPWMLGEDIPDMDLFFSQIWVSGFTNEFIKHTGRMYRKVMAVLEGYHLWFYYGEKDSNEVGAHLVKKMTDDPSFAVTVNREIIRASDALRAFAETVPDDLARLSSKALWELYRTHDKIHTAYYEWGWIPVAADMFHNNLTIALTDELRKRKVPPSKVNECFTILTQPTEKSLIQQEREEFLALALKIQSDAFHRTLFKKLYMAFEDQDASRLGLAPHSPQYEQRLEQRVKQLRTQVKPTITRLIERHYERYFYIKHMWIGKDGVYTFEHYLKELVKLIGRNSDIRTLIRENNEEFADAMNKRAVALRRYALPKKWVTLFDAFGGFMVTKIYRRFAQIYAIYRMQPVLEEIAQRLRLSLMQVRFMLVREVGDALMNGKIVRNDLMERTKFCVYYVERGKEAVYSGNEARTIAARATPKEISAVDRFTGQVGCMGKARGKVKIVIRPADMAKMNEGDVLVSIATDPDIVPAMKKASAIVTEQGGVTSHAAIVSRELNIPCVIGTKIATKVLKDGDLVDVDAEHGVVTIVKRA